MLENQKEIMVEAIQKIELAPGDILVVKVNPAIWTFEARKDLNEYVSKLMSNAKKDNEFIIIRDGDIKFETIGDKEVEED